MKNQERRAWREFTKQMREAIAMRKLDGYVPLALVMVKVTKPWRGDDVDLDVKRETIAILSARSIPNATTGTILEIAAERAREIG